jgi:hypothetical protein
MLRRTDAVVAAGWRLSHGSYPIVCDPVEDPSEAPCHRGDGVGITWGVGHSAAGGLMAGDVVAHSRNGSPRYQAWEGWSGGWTWRRNEM